MAATGVTASQIKPGPDPMLRLAAILSLGSAVLWAFLLFRWMTFGVFDWEPFGVELALAGWPAVVAYIVYGTLLVADLLIGLGLLREMRWARYAGIVRSMIVFTAAVLFYSQTREFYGATLVAGISGMMLLLLLKNAAGSLAYPAAFYLLVFFVIPNVIVLVVSLGDRARLGTVTYPPFDLTNLGAYFDDYARFFSRIGGEFIYLRIFGRSVLLAVANTLICLVFGYPFAYWIARQPAIQ